MVDFHTKNILWSSKLIIAECGKSEIMEEHLHEMDPKLICLQSKSPNLKLVKSKLVKDNMAGNLDERNFSSDSKTSQMQSWTDLHGMR